jgi:AmpD protein
MLFAWLLSSGVVRVRVDLDSGWMQGVRHVPSPNCDARPDHVDAELIVVHGISLPPGEFGGPWIDRLFTNKLPPEEHPYFAEIATLKVSSHLCIRRDGALTQYVSFHDRAWHAGRSCYAGREDCNDFSIGIELEGTDTLPYEAVQYRTLADCVTVLLGAYPRLSASRLVGHSDIAPGRKTDPGPSFDWGLARRLIGESLNARRSLEA